MNGATNRNGRDSFLTLCSVFLFFQLFKDGRVVFTGQRKLTNIIEGVLAVYWNKEDIDSVGST